MTPERRKYILEHLAKVTPNDNWIRIPTTEFDEFGGREFFQGCMVEYMRDEKYFTTRVGQRGWTKEERIQLPWKIHAPVGGGWKPPRPFNSNNNFVVTSNAAYFESNCTPTNETENTMEHHVNREEILEGLTEAKVKYQDLYTRFKDLYFGVATARLSAYVEGKIPHTSPVLPCDDKGVIGLYPEQSDRYDDMILAMQLDVRKVIEMTEGEFEAFAEHKGVDNSPTLTEAIERLERLA
jgi:hypothetical protein